MAVLDAYSEHWASVWFVDNVTDFGTPEHSAPVMLRTFSSPEAQRAWVDGVTSAHKGMTVSVEGVGYVALSTTYDREIMTVIGPALSQS